MREVLVAVFDTVAKADQAVHALEAAGISRTAIRRCNRDDPMFRHLNTQTTTQTISTTEPRETQSRGFWAWLLGEDEPSDWRDPTYAESDQLYGRTIERGNTVVAVYADPVDAERVMRLLADQLPIDVRDVGAETGMAAGDTTAAMQERRGAEDTTAAMRGTEERIPLAEEEVEIGKRRVEQPVRVHRYVTQRPVEQDVTLRDERVTIERRPASGTADPAAFQERTVEVREAHEEPTVTRRAKADEEVVVRREATERTERVQETARQEKVEIERDDKIGTSHDRTP